MWILEDTNLLLILVVTPTIMATFWLLNIQKKTFIKGGFFFQNKILHQISRSAYIAFVLIFYPLIIYRDDVLFTLAVLFFGLFFFLFVLISAAKAKKITAD